MFEYFKLYSHKRMLDAAILVLNSTKFKDGGYKLKVQWMNRRGMCLNITENVTIKSEEVKNWYEI